LPAGWCRPPRTMCEGCRRLGDLFAAAAPVNFSRTACTTFHIRGTASRVSVMCSPRLASWPPQHGHAVADGIDWRNPLDSWRPHEELEASASEDEFAAADHERRIVQGFTRKKAGTSPLLVRLIPQRAAKPHAARVQNSSHAIGAVVTGSLLVRSPCRELAEHFTRGYSSQCHCCRALTLYLYE
jgi:hypothetical protein